MYKKKAMKNIQSLLNDLEFNFNLKVKEIREEVIRFSSEGICYE